MSKDLQLTILTNTTLRPITVENDCILLVKILLGKV